MKTIKVPTYSADLVQGDVIVTEQGPHVKVDFVELRTWVFGYHAHHPHVYVQSKDGEEFCLSFSEIVDVQHTVED